MSDDIPLVKTPAFPFFGKDAYDDEQFSALSWTAKGVWQWLAWWQWQEGSIPADLDRIVDKCPYRLVDGLREAWLDVLPFFSVSVDDGKRLRDPHVEKRREKVAEGRLGKQRGAAITNEKRREKAAKAEVERAPSEMPSATLNATVSETLSVAHSVRSTLQVQVQEEEASSFGGVKRGEPVSTVAARIKPMIDASALDTHPPEQIVIAWLSEWDEELIRETLVDCETEYAGKHYKYLERILASRKANPHQRPAARRKGRPDERGNGNGAGRRGDHVVHVETAKRDVTVDDVRDAEREEREGAAPPGTADWLRYVREDCDRDLTRAQPRNEWLNNRRTA